jgi:hypothetical protein
MTRANDQRIFLLEDNRSHAKRSHDFLELRHMHLLGSVIVINASRAPAPITALAYRIQSKFVDLYDVKQLLGSISDQIWACLVSFVFEKNLRR